MEKVLLEYVEDHYPAGAGAVFAKDSGKMEFSLCISAAKFNPGNFWYGFVTKSANILSLFDW